MSSFFDHSKAERQAARKKWARVETTMKNFRCSIQISAWIYQIISQGYCSKMVEVGVMLYKVKNYDSYDQVDPAAQPSPHTHSWYNTYTDFSQLGAKKGETSPKSARPVYIFSILLYNIN